MPNGLENDSVIQNFGYIKNCIFSAYNVLVSAIFSPAERQFYLLRSSLLQLMLGLLSIFSAYTKPGNLLGQILHS